MNSALLLVDLQNDFLSAANLEPGRGEIIERTSALLESCRTRSIPVIHILTTVSRKDDERMPHWKAQNRWSCESGSAGHETPESLRPAIGETVMHKTRFSAFTIPDLEPHLRRLDISRIIIAGVYLHACVRQAALDAYERGFEVCIADDAVGSDDPVHAAITRRYLASRAASFRKVVDLMDDSCDDCGKGKGAMMFPRSTVIPSKAPLGDRLERVASSLEQEAISLAQAMAREIGKPIDFGEMEARRTAEMLRAVIRRCEGSRDEIQSSGVTLRRRPHGRVAIVTPWNNPIYIALGKIAPALLYGNTVAWKPSPHATIVSQSLLEILRSCDCGENELQFVQGDHTVAGELMADLLTDAVSLTGSSLAGYAAQEICARRHIPLQAELGGNNAAIVWDDCDLRDVARVVAAGAFDMAGQRCTANRRVIVHESVYTEFLRHLEVEAAAIPAGDPLQHGTRIGPMVSAAHGSRVALLIARSKAEGHRVIQVEPRQFLAPAADQIKAWHPPVLVCCDDPKAEIVQEESFGPVLVIQRARTWSEAMSLCNGVRQGLVAALFSNSVGHRDRFLEEARSGILKINRTTADAEIDVPFGGWKASGIGSPEHGACDLELYTRLQTVYREPKHDDEYLD